MNAPNVSETFLNTTPPSLIAGGAASNLAAAIGPVDAALVHKTHSANVFVSHIEPMPMTPQGHDCFLATLTIDPNHAFFFEHPIDHVPGLMLIEATRQTGTAISHQFYGVASGMAFVLNSFEVTFSHFAELSALLTVRFEIVDKQYRRDQLGALACESQWLQHGRVLGTMNARWTFSSPAILARLRRNEALSTAAH